MKKIKIIQISSDNGKQTLVGNTYELKRINSLCGAETKCGLHFFEGEYEIIESGLEKLKNALVADGYDVEIRYNDYDNHDAILIEVPGAEDYIALFLEHECEVSEEKTKEIFEHVYKNLGKAV